MKSTSVTFNNLGVMVDCSRNAVMLPEQLKKLIVLIARMGYNQLHLYTEDTYEIDGEPYFGYLRGRYTKEELKALDEYAYGMGVELIPNIQTLAHMTAFVGWRPDICDMNDILLVGEEKTYDLIDRMFRSVRECFRTNTLHIGMDEAHMLGHGKYYDKHGPQNRFDILLSHLNRVCEIADRYGFEPMMWSDMFYRLANGGEYYRTFGENFDASICERIPEKLTLVYWDYYSTDKQHYKTMFKAHQMLSDKIAFAGATWRWHGFTPDNDYTMRTMKASLSACIECGVKDVLITMWGDDGGECSTFALLPSLCYAACYAQGITNMNAVREKFYEWVGVRFDDFMRLGSVNKLVKAQGDVVNNPGKYFFYADCFMSKFLNTEKAEYAEAYAAIARRLRFAQKRAGEFAYLFDTQAKLAAVLALKVNICSRTRQAYESGDTALLDAVIADYQTMIKCTRAFYRAYRTQWYIENKPQGFEVQDVRIGGLIQRMTSCRERLIDYRDGVIESIPELEESIVPIAEGITHFNAWAQTVSNCIVGKQF